MTHETAPIPAGELRAALHDLDARGQRPSGLVMSPETWAAISTDAEPADRAGAVYAGLPVWLRLDCEGVELIEPADVSAPAQDPVWI